MNYGYINDNSISVLRWLTFPGCQVIYALGRVLREAQVAPRHRPCPNIPYNTLQTHSPVSFLKHHLTQPFPHFHPGRSTGAHNQCACLNPLKLKYTPGEIISIQF